MAGVERRRLETNADKGWALRVRDAALLALNSLKEQIAPVVEVVEISGEGLEYLLKLQGRLASRSSAEIVAAALKEYWGS